MNTIITRGLGREQLITRGYGYIQEDVSGGGGGKKRRIHHPSKLFREANWEFKIPIYTKIRGGLSKDYKISASILNKTIKELNCIGSIYNIKSQNFELNCNVKGGYIEKYELSTKVYNPYISFILSDL